MKIPFINKKQKNNNKPKRNWLLIFGGIVVLGIGIAIAFLSNAGKNPVGIALGFLLAAAGGYYVWKKYNNSAVIILGATNPDGTKKENIIANTLVITEGNVSFQDLKNDEIKGAQWLCRNDGQYYYVHKNNEEFMLPDSDPKKLYYHPKEYANVITMPLNRKYFAWSGTTFQKIALGVLAGIMVLEIIGVIAIGGPSV